jgi:hypothetical protein
MGCGEVEVPQQIGSGAQVVKGQLVHEVPRFTATRRDVGA